MTIPAQTLQEHWTAIGPLLSVHDEVEYDRAVEHLNDLLDEVGTNEEHPLYSLLDILGTLLHAYEQRHHPIPTCSGVDVLRFLMEEHGLAPSDLPELGTPDVVADILQDQRELGLPQIRALAQRFQVSPAVFI